MKDSDINYTIGGYSILDDVSTGLISIVTGSVGLVFRIVRRTGELATD